MSVDKLLKVDDVAAILQVSRRTAYDYMAQMIHLSSPLRVTESALREWLNARTAPPRGQEIIRGRNNADLKRRMAAVNGTAPAFRLPRRREEYAQ